MARVRNKDAFEEARSHLLSAGERLIRARSYKGVGLNDILKASGVPKGSFYHYFESKEAFGLEVARFYHGQQMQAARRLLRDAEGAPLVRLQSFFTEAARDYEARGFAEGCLMCNLTTELADESGPFQVLLKAQWRELSSEIGGCIAELGGGGVLGLAQLSDEEAADWLLNAWSGALARMKAERDAKPLQLFLKTVFKQGI